MAVGDRMVPMFQQMTQDELEALVDRSAALIAVTQRHLGLALRELDRREAWTADGAKGIVEWTQTRCGYERRTARAIVETTESLEPLPRLAQALEVGSVSLDQASAASKIENRPDAELAELAQTHAPAALRRMAAATREPLPPETRRFTWGWINDGAALRLSGRLPADDGQYVAAALDRLRESVPPDPETGQFQPAEQRGADALIELASLSLQQDSDPDRATVVVHVDAKELTGLAESGGQLPASSLDRILCDSTLQAMVESDSGTVGIGRRSRVVPHGVRRALHSRDTSCRFPGCSRTRWTHAHHIKEWVRDEGPTNLDNLVRLCGFHHRVIHRGWRIKGDPNDRLRWYRPDGRELTVGTGSLPAELHDRFIGACAGPGP